MRSAEGSSMVRVGASHVHGFACDLRRPRKDVHGVPRQRGAWRNWTATLPPKIGKLEGRALADVFKRLNALKVAHADAVPFALTIVARTPERADGSCIHLATKAVESKTAAAVAAAPYALDGLDVARPDRGEAAVLAVALRNNRVAVAKAILREIYAIETALKAQIELGNSDWARRLRDA